MTLATPTRPTGSSAFIDGLIATGGSGTVHQNTADDTDASYAGNDGTSTDGNIITFAAPSALPSGAVSSRAVLRARTAMLSSPGSVLMVGTGYTDITADGSVNISWTTAGTHNVFNGVQETWPTAPSVLVTMQPNPGGVYIALLYELYLDCYYVAQPTVTVVEPNVTNLNRPNIQWNSIFDTEGGNQTYYQVKIFDDAHYPANQAAITANTDYDDTSGITGGNSSEWRGTVALENDTYKAYVRVAQTVNGTIHWSTWDEEDFTISVTAAPTPTLSVSDDASNGRIAISVNSGGATTHIIQIQRSYDAGASWEDVRTEEGEGVISDWSASPDLYDYEAPNGTAASYRARAGRLYTDFYAYSAWTATASDTWTSSAYWLKHPYDPALNEAVALKASGTVERAGRVGVHQPIGDSEAVVVTDTPRMGTGEFEIFAHTEADRAPLEALLESGDPLLFQSPSAAALDDIWLVPGGWSRTRVIDNVGFPREVYSVPWSEVGEPEGNLE